MSGSKTSQSPNWKHTDGSRPLTKKEEKMDIVNLYSTVKVGDEQEIRKCFVTVVYPPESFAGFGIPKVILSDKILSEQEIDQNLEEMARQNARLLYEQAQEVAFTPGGGKSESYS